MDKPELRTPAATVKYIQQQLRYPRAEKLAGTKAGKTELLIGSVSGTNVANNPAVAKLIQKMQSMIAAVSVPAPPAASATGRPPRQPPRPSTDKPVFRGCWHRGDRNHSRIECAKYIALVGGLGPDGKPKRPPSDYKGAYERWKENQAKKAKGVASTVSLPKPRSPRRTRTPKVTATQIPLMARLWVPLEDDCEGSKTSADATCQCNPYGTQIRWPEQRQRPP